MSQSTGQTDDAIESSIRFILDGEIVALQNVDPTRSVLQYLREDIYRTGTKEGCAEGDCGACTVVLGELKGGRLQLKAVNACILFLPTLDSKILFTIESLKHYSDSQPHPAQQAMVKCHGSQCGFCTPGFVMSMVALYKQIAKPTQAEISNSLSGNLCRCTGYRPIIDATKQMYESTSSTGKSSVLHQVAGSEPDEAEQALITQLQSIQRQKMMLLESGARRYTAPVTLEQFATEYVKHSDALILAGGTDIGLWVTKQQRVLQRIIYLGHIEALKQIEANTSHMEIGAAVTLTDAFTALGDAYPEITDLFRRFASMPIRNSGTLGGNIANGSPIGDSMPVLITLGATVVLRRGDQQRELPMEALYLDYQKTALTPGEFIQTIRVPINQSATQVRSYKIAKRYDQDISAVCAAFCVQLDGDTVAKIRIAYGGMAATPKRASQAEQTLMGQRWDESTVQLAMAALAQDYKPLADMRASANYRMKVAQNTLYRFYLETRPDKPLSASQVNAFEVA